MANNPSFLHGRGVSCRTPGRGESGTVAVLVALTLLGLLALFLLAVQVGDVGTIRGMLQGGADQAALSGASRLDGTQNGLEDARRESESMLQGGRNFVRAANAGQDLSIAGDAFQTGVYEIDHPEKGFEPSTDPKEVNAVRVIGRKTDTANGEVPMFLGGFLGPEQVALQRSAIAATGACQSVPCHPDLPLAVCQEPLRCGEKIRLAQSNSSIDNSAWTGFDLGHSASVLRSIVSDCHRIPDVGTGDALELTNGQDTSVLQALKLKLTTFIADNPCPNIRKPDLSRQSCDGECRPETSGSPIDVNGDGIVGGSDCGMPVTVPLISCNGVRNLNKSLPASGFVMMVITDVVDSGSPKYVEAIPLCGIRVPGAPTGPGPTCDSENPVCCATEPVLVNSSQ